MNRALEAARLVLDRYPELRLAVVFGSHASGEATERSDVDVTVRGEADRNPPAAELSRALGSKATAVPFDTGDLVHLPEIVRDGRLLVEGRSGTLARFHSHALATLEANVPSVRRERATFTARIAGSGLPPLGTRE